MTNTHSRFSCCTMKALCVTDGMTPWALCARSQARQARSRCQRQAQLQASLGSAYKCIGIAQKPPARRQCRVQAVLKCGSVHKHLLFYLQEPEPTGSHRCTRMARTLFAAAVALALVALAAAECPIQPSQTPLDFTPVASACGGWLWRAFVLATLTFTRSEAAEDCAFV